MDGGHGWKRAREFASPLLGVFVFSSDRVTQTHTYTFLNSSNKLEILSEHLILVWNRDIVGKKIQLVRKLFGYLFRTWRPDLLTRQPPPFVFCAAARINKPSIWRKAFFSATSPILSVFWCKYPAAKYRTSSSHFQHESTISARRLCLCVFHIKIFQKCMFRNILHPLTVLFAKKNKVSKKCHQTWSRAFVWVLWKLFTNKVRVTQHVLHVENIVYILTLTNNVT